MPNSTITLRPGEEIWRCYRAHPMSLAPEWALGMVLLCLSAFLVWPLARLGTWGLFVLASLFICGSLTLWRTATRWRKTQLILTNMRLIDVARLGWLATTVSQLEHSALQDTSWSRRGLWSALWRYGSVHVTGEQGTVHLVFPNLPAPAKVVDFLLSLKRLPLRNSTTATQKPDPIEQSLPVENVFK